MTARNRPNGGRHLTRWGLIAAIAATITIAAPAAAEEASDNAALGRKVLSSSVGVSSYYGPGFHGRATADGETFDMHAITAAHKTLPLPCYARVTNLHNGRSIVVRVNDRGPYIQGRILDVSDRVARLLGYDGGLAKVRLDYLGKAGKTGAAEQRELLASLKNGDEPIAVARAKPVEDGVSVVRRSAPALSYAAATRAPAAAALDAAVRPVAPPVAPNSGALDVAAKLDASVRQLQAALEAAHRTAQSAAQSLSPFGQLVLAPFKPVIEASR